MPSNLQNILQGAGQLNEFLDQPRQIEHRAKMDELALKEREAGLDENLRQLKESGALRQIAQWYESPDEMKPQIMRRMIVAMQARGDDTSGLQDIINAPLEMQKRYAEGIMSAAYRMGNMQAPRAETSQPSAVREYQFFQSLDPQERETFMQIKRATPAARPAEFGGQKGVLHPDGTFTPISSLEEEVEAAATEEGATTRARVETQTEIERAEAAPARTEKARMLVSQIDNTINRAQEAQGLVSGKTAGFGSLLSIIPTTSARELSTLVDTIRANLGFDRLQQMRDASPTGGALGQVSEKEIDFLQSSVQNLDTGVDPDVLKKRLQEIVESYQRWKDAVIEARGRDLMRDMNDREAVLEQLRREFPNAG